jgi:hypothetical protein
LDWWPIVLNLSLIGVISVLAGIIVGIPLSNKILRRREQVATGKYRISSKFKPQHTTTDQLLDELLKKYGVFELKTAEQGSEETAEKGIDEAESNVRQVEPIASDRILFELEKNLELSIEPRLDKLEPFQTETRDASSDIPNILTTDLNWELTEAYLDMYSANNIIWVIKETEMESPFLNDEYVKMCSQISAKLSRIIPMLKTAR